MNMLLYSLLVAFIMVSLAHAVDDPKIESDVTLLPVKQAISIDGSLIALADCTSSASDHQASEIRGDVARSGQQGKDIAFLMSKIR
jgi:hypothetical protein